MTAQDGSQPLEFQELAPEAMIAQAERFYAQMQARRSVRDFSDRPVPMRVIDQAILAAGTAPSGANKQPWHFAMTTDPEVKLAIRIAAEQEEQAFYERRASQQWLDALAPLGTDANKPFLQTAPVLVGVFMEKTAVSAQGERSKNYYPMESVGIACGLLISALHLSGLVTLT
ncbi:MAG: nitroreductase family protein, partial [Pseudomonadales bacterium]|nr:nitroreductase family protein [Pseudomonadales bacterium]